MGSFCQKAYKISQLGKMQVMVDAVPGIGAGTFLKKKHPRLLRDVTYSNTLNYFILQQFRLVNLPLHYLPYCKPYGP